jgi:1-deoxy-D-xylulose-5-phosphate synthase
MSSGTGLAEFAEKYPDRFFDVGIAEQHAVTFAGGLAANGMKPYFAVYSSFLQRGFDQVLHDVALQRLPVVFCLDRAGLVGDDGPTHHGAFDISYLRTIPGLVIVAPKDGRELRDSLAWAATYDEGPVAIRYPRASIPEETVDMGVRPIKIGSWEIVRDGKDIAILAVGSMVYNAWKAADILDKDRIDCRVINCRFISPPDENLLTETLKNYDRVLTICENGIKGGFGEGINRRASELGTQNNIKILGIPDRFIEHGDRDLLLSKLGLDPEGIAMSVLELAQLEIKHHGARKKN